MDWQAFSAPFRALLWRIAPGALERTATDAALDAFPAVWLRTRAGVRRLGRNEARGYLLACGAPELIAAVDQQMAELSAPSSQRERLIALAGEKLVALANCELQATETLESLARAA